MKNWITLNEILCFTRLGYGNGQKVPGFKLPEQVVNQTYHTALLVHGHGVGAVREHGGKGARVGLLVEKTPTGEPDAGDPPVRFGERGGFHPWPDPYPE